MDDGIEYGLDLAVTIVAALLMITITLFSTMFLKASFATQVEDKTAIQTNEYYEVSRPVMTVKELLAQLAVSDAYQVAPTNIVICRRNGSQLCNIDLGTPWAQNKEEGLKNARATLAGYINATVINRQVNAAGTTWTYTLSS